MDKTLHLVVKREETQTQTIKLEDKNLLKKRLYAFSIDLFAIAIIEKLLFVTFLFFASDYLHSVPIKFKSSIWWGYTDVHLPMIITTYFSYFFLSLYITDGKTLGKTVMHLRVISNNIENQHLSLFESILRSIGYTLCYLSGFLLFALPYMTITRKGLPDWLSKTVVMTDQSYALALLENKQSVRKESGETQTNQLELFLNN